MVPKRIVVIGSSSAEGKVDPEFGGFAGRLRAWHESISPHNHVFNLAISGDTTAGMLKRLVIESKPRSPDLILIQHGLNDTLRRGNKSAPNNIPIAQFKNNVVELIQQAKILAKVAVISVYPIDDSRTSPVSWDNIYYLLADAKIYTQAAKEICQKTEIPYLDIFNQWIKTDYEKYLYEDGLHTNSLGHKIIFEELKKFLEF